MNFQGREIFKRFSIDRLSQMTLYNSLFSQKENFYDTPTKHIEREVSN